jgi:hypothetical protein
LTLADKKIIAPFGRGVKDFCLRQIAPGRRSSEQGAPSAWSAVALSVDMRPPRFCPRSELLARDKNLREARYVLGEQTSEVWTWQQPCVGRSGAAGDGPGGQLLRPRNEPLTWPLRVSVRGPRGATGWGRRRRKGNQRSAGQGEADPRAGGERATAPARQRVGGAVAGAWPRAISFADDAERASPGTWRRRVAGLVGDGLEGSNGRS